MNMMSHNDMFTAFSNVFGTLLDVVNVLWNFKQCLLLTS